jgi:SAM-dependent methyltransferase
VEVLEEFRASGLDLSELPGNTGKLRLALDLAAELRAAGRMRVLDVGCAGPEPLNLWLPFQPLWDRLELVAADVAGLDRVEARARDLGLALETRAASAIDLRAFRGFDAVVSTQVLEHVREWRRALGEMAAALRPGGALYATCDSGDTARPRAERVRLTGKRAFARARARWPALERAPVSGEWERAPRAEELRAAAVAAGVDVERLERYSLRALKRVQRAAGSETRQLWLALEESLAADGGARPDDYAILYLRARRPPDVAER